jgi:hypothetical protein
MAATIIAASTRTRAMKTKKIEQALSRYFAVLPNAAKQQNQSRTNNRPKRRVLWRNVDGSPRVVSVTAKGVISYQLGCIVAEGLAQSINLGHSAFEKESSRNIGP